VRRFILRGLPGATCGLAGGGVCGNAVPGSERGSRRFAPPLTSAQKHNNAPVLAFLLGRAWAIYNGEYNKAIIRGDFWCNHFESPATSVRVCRDFDFALVIFLFYGH
jgi:hypothetical protein